MQAKWLVPLAFMGAAMLAGCAGEGGGAGTEVADAPATTSGSSLDAGPRASESPVDDELVATGKQLFADKGCSACHAFGQKLSGPDLAGVASRRTSAWIQNQILHPDVMAKEDPIARGLIAEHALQMPNQGLNPDEAKAVIEFLKSKEHPEDDSSEDGS